MDAGDAEGEPPTGVIAYWVQGASEETRDAHYRALRWAHALAWQIDRLYEARRTAIESNRRVREASFYGEEDAWPFYKMDAEAHFALVAARQLLRALRAFDGDDRLPPGMTNAQVRDLRDALEHWDVEGGSDAGKRLIAAGGDPAAHQWSLKGPGVLGKVISDEMLRQWAVNVYGELQRWDPYDGWRDEAPTPER